MRKTIYLVSEGSYSDYRISFVCEDHETARGIVAANSKDGTSYTDYEIEEYEIVPQGTKFCHAVQYRIYVELKDDGSVGTKGEYSYERSIELPIPTRPEVHYSRRPIGNGDMLVEGYDEQAVHKAFTERIAAFKSGAWIPQGLNIKPKSP